MKSVRLRLGLLALLVLLAATAACTNSEQLSSGVSPVPVEILVVNPDTRFDRAFFDVIQVTVRPLNPDAAAALGTDPLWMLETGDDPAFEINLNGEQNQFESNSQLTIGPYEVQSVTLQRLEFRNGERLGTATCEEYITDYPDVQKSVQLFEFDEPVIVQVTLGAASQLRMVIDGTALSLAFERSWRCAQGAACGGLPPWPLWCISPPNDSAFNSDAFSLRAPSFLSFP
jgi:hypothetical protein